MRCSVHHRASEIAASALLPPRLVPFFCWSFQKRLSWRKRANELDYLLFDSRLWVGFLLSCGVTVGWTYKASTGALQSLIDRGPVLLLLYLETCENKNGRDKVKNFSISQGRADLPRRRPYGSTNRSPYSFLRADGVGRNSCLEPQAMPLAYSWTELTSQRSPMELVLNNSSLVQMCCPAQI